MVAPLMSGVPVAVMVWITPGASRPDCASLLTLAEYAAIAAMSWPPMPGMSAPMGTPACCCIAPACAIASAALCLACLALSKSPMALASCSGGRSPKGTPNRAGLQRTVTRVRARVAELLPLAVHEPVDEASERAAHVGVESVGAVERVACLHRVIAGDAQRELHRGRAGGEGTERERAGGVELLGVEWTTEQLVQLGGLAHHVDDGQRVDALEQVLAGVLAERVVGRRQVEHVVDDLEAHAEVTTEARERVEGRVTDARHHAADATRRREQRGGLAFDGRRVVLFRTVDVEEMLEFEHLAPAQLAD